MIYVIQSAGYDSKGQFIDLIKIGYTQNWKNRKEVYDAHNPTIKILYLSEAGDRADEASLHLYFRKFRFFDYGKEWYVYSNEIIDFFTNFPDFDEMRKSGVLPIVLPDDPESKGKLLKDDLIKSELSGYIKSISQVTGIDINQITQDVLEERLVNDRAFEIYINTYYPERSDDIKTIYELRKGEPNKVELDFINEFCRKSDSMKLRLLCTDINKLPIDSQKVIFALVNHNYSNIISELGKDLLSEINYNFSEAKKRYSSKLFNISDLADRVYEEFHSGDHLSDEYIKTKLGEIYRELDYPETRWPSSKEINKFFATESIKVLENGKFIRGKILHDGLLYDWGNKEVVEGNVGFIDKLKSTFLPGDRIPCSVIKAKLKLIYKSFNYTRTAKSTDILEWFVAREVELSEKGKRLRGYEIVGFIDVKNKKRFKVEFAEGDCSPAIESDFYNTLKLDVYHTFRYRYKVSTKEIVKILNKVLKKRGYYRTAKISDIDVWFETRPCQINNEDGRVLIKFK